MKVDNAIIMAAGTSSRFAPLSYEKHKALIDIRGEILIERQIKQLLEAGIPEIIIITGYKAEQFYYLQDKYGIKLVHNPDYLIRNNNSSIWAVKDYLHNSYICSSDNYFLDNPFETNVSEAYYAAQYANGTTSEWCLEEDSEGYISSVKIGGENAWYMFGHTFWDEQFSSRFISILAKEYYCPETAAKLWEDIYIEHLDVLKMRLQKYAPGFIFEFDTLDELRQFDNSYFNDTRSDILKEISKKLQLSEAELSCFKAIKDQSAAAVGFTFKAKNKCYQYLYNSSRLEQIEE